jgi:SAM-dependent methyltransferase
VTLDIRAGPARFYDLGPHHPNDVPFYLERLPTPHARVLELGCGTGRVSIPLADRCAFLHGLDLSEAMLQVCRSKLKAAGLGEEKVRVEAADITDFELSDRFDLVIAPFRVMQNLETDEQLAGLFHCIRQHLGEGGRCILNVFHPKRPPETMREVRVPGPQGDKMPHGPVGPVAGPAWDIMSPTATEYKRRILFRSGMSFLKLLPTNYLRISGGRAGHFLGLAPPLLFIGPP